MKTAVVCFTGGSGLTHYSVSLARELARYGEVEFITASNFDLHAVTLGFSVNTLFRRTRHYPLDIVRFVLHILRTRPDWVLFESWLKYPLLEGFIAALFGLAGIRTAMTIHDLLPHYPKPWSRRLHAWFYRRFDRLIVHSESTAAALREMGVPTEPLVVPHGVYDIFRLADLSRKDVLAHFPGLGPDDFVVLYFGHVETRKGILEFLRASERLAGETGIKFVVAGKNDLAGEAAQELERARGRPNLILHDRLIPFEAVQRYFVLADVVALPYREGTTSGVMKLAMAFAKPVIASDVGDLRETLRDWPGRLVATHELGDGLVREILDMRAGYSALRAGAAGASAKYSWHVIGKAYQGYLG
ncbi:MAG: glycosyltransferase family 4 protein [Hydrogenophilales bacterium]|nr:glycosyltransferase family 4 protein [Hydrogenophilales bacterium]